MSIKRTPPFVFLFLSLFILQSCNKAGVTDSSIQLGHKSGNLVTKPFRVLIVIDQQWTDPLSYNIDARRVRGSEFTDIVTMLKIWGVPFDILRLDQQRLQINRFLDGEARPAYGCIVWMADPDKLEGHSADYSTLRRAVTEYGISMIALFDNIRCKPLAELAGIDYQGTETINLGENGIMFSVSGNHYLTRDIGNFSLPDSNLIDMKGIPASNGITQAESDFFTSHETLSVIKGRVKDSAMVAATIGDLPQIVVNDITGNSKVIWIGGGKEWFRKYPVMRDIFRKSLVSAIGYGLFNDNFTNGFIFIMDDIGCSEHAWSLRWHYPTPARDTLIKYLIEPLERNGLIMVQNITPGFADPERKIIVPPWTVEPFRDIFGNWQDYGSTKEGLDEGLKRGVFEIQPHRAWSHMNWDLDSYPGPWWGSAVDGEMAVTDWYNEIVDVRRGRKPVPSNDLLFIYKTGIDAIKKAFGVTPLAAEVRTGAEVTVDTEGGDDIGRIAAIAGLGVSRECYVGTDRTIEFSMMMPEQFTCHDLDLTARTSHKADQSEQGWDSLLNMTTSELLSARIAGGRRINLHDNQKWIDRWKNKRWMGFNEVCAYLHTDISQTGLTDICLELKYDEHYCRHFEKKPSAWTLEISENYLNIPGSSLKIKVDGQIVSTKPSKEQAVAIPPGTGSHTVSITAD